MEAESLSIALIGPDGERRRAMASALAEDRRADVREFESYPAGPDEFRWLLEQSFDLIVLDLDSDPEIALDLVERVKASDVSTTMVYSERADTKLAIRYMRAGARDYLLLPLEPGIVAEALDRTAAFIRDKSNPAGAAAGQLLVCLCAKGGSGVTTVACNLAIALARKSNQRALLIDLALPIGDAALTLGITEKYSTEDAIRNADRLDTNLLKELLVRHSSGLFVLAAPSKVTGLEGCGDAIDKVIAVARREFDHVIVDVGSRTDVLGTSLFKKASTIYLVTLTGVSELRNSNRLISQFFSEGGPSLEIVVNRFENRRMGGVNEDVITKALGRPVRWKIPDDPDAAREMQLGQTGRGETRISRLSLEMAGAIAGSPVPQERQDRKRGFGPASYGRAVTEEVSGNDRSSSIQIVPSPIARQTPTIAWPAPAPMTYGEALSTAQLNAEASAPGSLVYTPVPGAVMPAGTHTLSVTFTPADSENYATADATVQLHVERATPVIDWPNPDPIPYRTPLSSTHFGATAPVPGRFEYSAAPGLTLAAGTHTLSVTFIPADSENYTTAEAAVQLHVERATPVIDWPNPDPIPYGTPLGDAQLRATSPLAGRFEYSPASGAALAAGTHTLLVTFTPTDSENYTTAEATVPLKVDKATPVVEWSNPDPIPYGTPLSEAQLRATSPLPGRFEYSPAPGAVLAAGAHKLSVIFTPREGANYTTAQAAVSLTVAGAMPVIEWPTPKAIQFGTPLSAAQFCAVASVPGTFDYSPAPGAVLAAGTHTLSLKFTPMDTESYAAAEATVTLKVAKAMPTFEWPAPRPIKFGTRLGARQLCATASVPGTFDYSPEAGAVLPTGLHTLSVTFTPTDSANYSAARATLSLSVAKATPAIEWPVSEPVTFGTPLGARQLCATASVPGTFDYSPAPGVVLAAGAQTLSVIFTPRDSANYVTTEATVPLIVLAIPVIAWPSPDQITHGTPLSSKQLCATASVAGAFEYSPAPGEVMPAGTHRLSVIFTPTDSSKYASAQATVPLTVTAKAMPVIAWPHPDPIPYGTPLGETQLCATASVPGKFEYSVQPGAVLAAGTYTLSVTFTPRDSVNYAAAQAIVSLKVAKATPTIDWPAPQSMMDETPLSATQLCATAPVPGTFDYFPPAGVAPSPGTHTLSATFTPADGANYATTQATVPLTVVAKPKPAMAWPNPDPITYGTPLSPAQLCAAASVPGSFDYSHEPGVVLGAGTHTLSVTFTPRDRAKYALSEASVSLMVARATPSIEWPRPKGIQFGTQLSARQLCASASVPGKFEYSPEPGAVLAAGTHELSVIFTPEDGANYATAQGTVVLDVARATPAIEWPEPQPATFGTPLGARQLCATAPVPGTFDYFPAPGEMLAVGTHKLTVTFTPKDSTNYVTTQATVSLNVVVKPTPVIAWSNPDPIPYGTRLSVAQLCATASVPGRFDYSPAQDAVLAAGTHTLSATFTPGDSENFASTQTTVSLKVNRATPIIDWPTPKAIEPGTALSAVQLDAAAWVPGTFVYSPGVDEVLPQGTHTLTVTFTPSDSANYTTAQATVSLKVAAKTIPVIAWSNPDPIPCGRLLGPTQLCATASVPGTFDYSPARGAILAAGTHTLSVSFVPSDTETYRTTQATVMLQVEELPEPFSEPPKALRESDASQWLDPYDTTHEEPIASDRSTVDEAARFQPLPSSLEVAEKPNTARKRWIFAAVGACSILLILIFLVMDFRSGTKSAAAQPSVQPLPVATNTPLKSNPPKPTLRTLPASDKPTQVQTELMNDQLTAPAQIPRGVEKQTLDDAPPSTSIATAGLDGSGAMVSVFKGNAPRVVTVAPPAPSGPVTISAGVAVGLLIQKRLPIYPPMAKEARVSGTVELQATISKTGTIKDLHVVSGPDMLRQAAVDAVRNWRYKPYKLDNQPIDVETTISIVFSLGG